MPFDPEEHDNLENLGEKIIYPFELFIPETSPNASPNNSLSEIKLLIKSRIIPSLATISSTCTKEILTTVQISPNG